MCRYQSLLFVVAPKTRRLSRGQRLAINQYRVTWANLAGRCVEPMPIDAYATVCDPSLRLAP